MGTIPCGRLVVVSGPSGAGKTTLLARLLQRCPLPLRRSVSATTRPPRKDERDKIDYQFLTIEEFERLRQEGGFLECAEVFGKGRWYGTPWSEVTSARKDGKWVVLNIDVQGAVAVMDRYPDAITIFVHPGSLEELQRRLRHRGTESEEAVARRLEEAKHELALADRYRHQVVNDDIDRAVEEICGILTQQWEADHHDRRTA